MARRASQSKIDGKHLLSLIALVAVLGIVAVFLFTRSKEKSGGVASALPVEDFKNRGSMLRDNQYDISGKIEERTPCGDSEIITIVVSNGGVEHRLCIMVSSSAKTVNLERGHEYIFTVMVRDFDDKNKGILVAKEIEPVR